MAYRTIDRVASGIVFFGPTPADQTFESSSNFRIDTSNSRLITPNITINDGGKIGSASQTGILTLGSDGIATFSSGVIVNGNLTINGTTTTINTETLTVDDNIIVLNNNYTGATPSENAGIEVERGTQTNVSFLWDETSDYWAFSNTAGTFFEIASRTGTQNFLNKTIDGTLNTLTNIGNASLTNSSITVTAGSGLANGGTVSLGGTVTLNVGAGNGIAVAADTVAVDYDDSTIGLVGGKVAVKTSGITNTQLNASVISGQTAITTVDGTNDFILIWDATDSSLKKVNRANFVTGLGTMSSFTLSADSGSDQTISDGNTLEIAGGVGITTAASATDTVTITLDISEFSATALASGDSFLVLDSDGATEQRATVTQLGTYLAGTNVTAGGDGKLSVTNASIEGVVFDSANFVDGTTIDFTVTAGQSVTAEVKANSISATYLTASVAGAGLTGGNGTALAVDISEFSAVAVASGDSFLTLDSNGSTEQRTTVMNLGGYLAGNGLVADGAGVLSVGEGTLIDVAADSISVDLSEATEAAIANGDYILFLDGGATGTAAKESLADLATFFAGAGMTSTNSVLNVIGGDGITVNADEVEVTVDNSTIELSATNGTGAVRIKDDGVTDAKLRNSAGLSVIGRSANTTGDPADITAGTDGHVLRRSGTTLGFGFITAANLSRTVVNITNTGLALIQNACDIVIMSAATNNAQATLPAPSTGAVIVFKRTDSSTNTCTITRNAAETIDGATSIQLYYQYESVTLVSDGTNWFVV